MTRLIDADALYKSFGATGNCNNCPLDAYKCQYYNEHTLMEFCERIEDAPTIDAEPVRHGHWKYHPAFAGATWGFYECSECGDRTWTIKHNYCSSCGTRMDLPDICVGKMDETCN